MARNMDFSFASHAEICAELGARLRRQRLAQLLSQSELAARAGVSVGTVKTLESSGAVSLDTLVRVCFALGVVDDLAGLFELRVHSVADMERRERAEGRKRAPRRRRPAATEPDSPP
jgi:transcriptional regulator with XRE-family HTH domain